MKISSSFNRLIHGLVLPQIHKIRRLELDYGAKKLTFYPFYFSKEGLKSFLKLIDFNYPRDKDGVPLSYTQLNEVEMLKHCEFLEMLVIDNGFEIDFKDNDERCILS